VNRPPAPIFAVVILLTLLTVITTGAVSYAVTQIGAGVLIGLILPLLTAFAALGLWQGTRGSRVITIALGVLLSLLGLNDRNTTAMTVGLPLLGLVVVLLVAAPSSSREWFNRPNSD
jgi:ACR3 family arsenite efflux pump ArsB